MASANDPSSELVDATPDWTFDEIADSICDNYLPDLFLKKIKMYKRGLYKYLTGMLASVERMNSTIDIFKDICNFNDPNAYIPAPQDCLFYIDDDGIEAIDTIVYNQIIADNSEFMRQQRHETLSCHPAIIHLQFMFCENYRYMLIVEYYYNLLRPAREKHRVFRGSDGKISFEKVESLR